MKRRIAALLLIIGLVICGFILSRKEPGAINEKPDPTISYGALGDSVAAGVGLGQYVDASACDRTDEAYPVMVASQLNYRLHNLACSGATVPAGIDGKQTVNRLELSSQIDALTAKTRYDVISISVGANDLLWTEVLQQCYLAVCGTSTDDQVIDARLSDLQNSLAAAVEKIKIRAPGAKIYVVGYYQLFAGTDTECSDASGVDGDEQAWMNQMHVRLNDAVKTATDDAAVFVPVSFAGHQLCTDDPWIQGVADARPYHPTKEGQRQIARQLVTALKAAQ